LPRVIVELGFRPVDFHLYQNGIVNR
jgi:hypothetical protein